MRDFEFPPDHRPGMKVPTGGSSCASCEYLAKDKRRCNNDYFVAWHGSDVIPGRINEYCSDWYEPRRPKYRTHEGHQNNLMNDWAVNETWKGRK